MNSLFKKGQFAFLSLFLLQLYKKMSKKVKIAHSLDELQDQVILTLVDKPILNEGQLDLDQDDILQNDEIQLNNEAKHNAQLKTKLKNIADASSSHLEAKNQGASGILPHYNDYSYKPSQVQVENQVVIKPKRSKKNKGLGSDYLQNDASTTVKLNSEYTSKRQDKKTKTSTRDLLNFLDDTAEDNISLAKKEEEIDFLKDSMEQIRKKRILDSSIKNIAQVTTIDDDQESILLKSIERSRKKAEQINKQRFNVLEAIKEEQNEENQNGKKTVELELNPISYQSTEIVRRNKNVDLKEALGGTSSVMFAHLPSQKLAKKEQQEEAAPANFSNFSKSELQKMRKQIQFLEDKEQGIGLAGTLAYLRQNSLLGQEEQVGRYNDKSVNYNDPNDRIQLQYRNASGQLMKPKEAFRYISAKFHGEGSGKNKIQKRKKRQLQEQKIKQRANEDGQMLKLLKQHQQKKGQAHLVLNIGGKSKQ